MCLACLRRRFDFFDPTTQDTTLQISDATGQTLCTTIAAKNWMHPRRSLFSFRDRQETLAAGLRRALFKIKRSRQVLFRARGGKVSMRPMATGDVNVTVRVGNACSRSTAVLRLRKTSLVFP